MSPPHYAPAANDKEQFTFQDETDILRDPVLNFAAGLALGLALGLLLSIGIVWVLLRWVR